MPLTYISILCVFRMAQQTAQQDPWSRTVFLPTGASAAGRGRDCGQRHQASEGWGRRTGPAGSIQTEWGAYPGDMGQVYQWGVQHWEDAACLFSCDGTYGLVYDIRVCDGDNDDWWWWLIDDDGDSWLWWWLLMTHDNYDSIWYECDWYECSLMMVTDWWWWWLMSDDCDNDDYWWLMIIMILCDMNVIDMIDWWWWLMMLTGDDDDIWLLCAV